MINVLFIGMTNNFGGMESYMINIFSSLKNHGFHFDFINMQNNTIAYSDYIKKNGGKIYNINIQDSRFKHLTRMHKAKHFFAIHNDYDIVHLNTTYLNQIYWIKAAKKYGIKHLIIQSHNSGMDYKSFLFECCNKILDKLNRAYLYTHPNIKKLAASKHCGQWMFGKGSKFTIIKNGINTDNYVHNPRERKYFRNKLNIGKHFKVLITTSRIEHQKNYPKIIRVFKCIHDKDKYTKLVIIGTGTLINNLRSLILKYNLNKSVYLLGELDKQLVNKLLNIADLMIMPSLYEGLPFSLVESQAAGIPSLVSSEAVPKDVNVTGKVNYLSLLRSNKEWANVAIRILKNNKYNIHSKLDMNREIRNSCYGIRYSSNQIRNYYLSLMKV